MQKPKPLANLYFLIVENVDISSFLGIAITNRYLCK